MTESNFTALEVRVGHIETKLEENTKTTNEIAVSVADAVEFLNAAKGAMKVLDMIGRLAKPLSYIVLFVSAIVGVWTTIKSGISPK